MKKAVLIIAVLLLVGSFVFAQDAGVKIGAWGRGLFVPVIGGDNLNSIDAVSWGAAPRVGFTVSGSSANVGFQADITADKGKIDLGDQQKVWVKPISMLTLQVGRIFDDTLRGSIGFGAWNWLRYAGETGDGIIFGRVGETSGQKNFEVSVAPIEGLYVFAGLGGILGTQILASDMMAGGQYGAGYTIAGIGTIRAQYDGASKDLGAVQAAFKLTAVDKLTVDVGGKYFLALTDAGKAILNIDTAPNAQMALGVSYGLDTLSVNAMANVSLIKTGDPSLEFGAGASYGLGDGLSVEGDVRYLNKVASGFNSGAVGAMIGLAKSFSNGTIGLGVEITTGDFVVATKATDPTNSKISYAIPVKLEYSF